MAPTRQRQPGGNIVSAWATETDWDLARLVSNTFGVEWPRRSGRRQEFPEVDRAEWFDLAQALRRMLPGQRCFLEALFYKPTGERLVEH